MHRHRTGNRRVIPWAALLVVPVLSHAGRAHAGAPAAEVEAEDAEAVAEDDGAELEGEGTVEVEGGGATATASSTDREMGRAARFFTDPAPRAGTVELGLYGGLYLPSLAHSLVGGEATFKQLDLVLGSVGARAGHYPLSWMGFEFEAGGFPGFIDDEWGGGYVQLYHFRGHVLFQLPYRLAPFVLGGVSGFVVNSEAERLGIDTDAGAQIGAGLKFWVLDWLALRAEWRGTLGPHRDAPEETRVPAFHNEILLGVSFTLGPRKAEPQPAPVAQDSDGDGFSDPNDRCPRDPGGAPDGCPIPDRDGDGFRNEVDACPDEPGVSPDGCPVDDRDRDGIADEEDDCPDDPGVAPDGCPIADRDKDQILDPDDKCPDEPETRNGFEDTDGCPDELPKEVEKFTGIIRGIYFDLDKATIQKRSFRVLDDAVEVLQKYPTIRLEIVGHTDNSGEAEYNRKLSQKRAEAVRDYLIKKGIDSSRLKARGAGEEAPVASNDTPTGRAENRRTEFNIIDDEVAAP